MTHHRGVVVGPRRHVQMQLHQLGRRRLTWNDVERLQSERPRGDIAPTRRRPYAIFLHVDLAGVEVGDVRDGGASVAIQASIFAWEHVHSDQPLPAFPYRFLCDAFIVRCSISGVYALFCSWYV